MDREQEERRKHEREVERVAENSRRKLDETPPPGTDPLHEGP